MRAARARRFGVDGCSAENASAAWRHLKAASLSFLFLFFFHFVFFWVYISVFHERCTMSIKVSLRAKSCILVISVSEQLNEHLLVLAGT